MRIEAVVLLIPVAAFLAVGVISIARPDIIQEYTQSQMKGRAARFNPVADRSFKPEYRTTVRGSGIMITLVALFMMAVLLLAIFQ